MSMLNFWKSKERESMQGNKPPPVPPGPPVPSKTTGTTIKKAISTGNHSSENNLNDNQDSGGVITSKSVSVGGPLGFKAKTGVSISAHPHPNGGYGDNKEVAVSTNEGDRGDGMAFVEPSDTTGAAPSPRDSKKGYIQDLLCTVTALESDVASYESENLRHQSVISEHVATIEQHRTEIEAQRAVIEQHVAAIAIHQSQIKNQGAVIDEHLATIGAHQIKIAALMAVIENQKAEIESKDAIIDNHATRIAGHDAEVSALKQKNEELNMQLSRSASIDGIDRATSVVVTPLSHGSSSHSFSGTPRSDADVDLIMRENESLWNEVLYLRLRNEATDTIRKPLMEVTEEELGHLLGFYQLGRYSSQFKKQQMGGRAMAYCSTENESSFSIDLQNSNIKIIGANCCALYHLVKEWKEVGVDVAILQVCQYIYYFAVFTREWFVA
jgi:hypothetical protein